MKLNTKIIGFVLAGLVLLPGCVRVPNYKPKSLDSIKSFNNILIHRETKSNVTVGISVLNNDAKLYLFNDRDLLFDNEKVEVIHISVHNLSTDQYIISPAEISIPQIPYSDVLQSVQTSSRYHLKNAGRVGGSVYGVLSGLTFSVFYLPTLLGSTVDKFGIGLVLTLAGAGFVWPIVATIIASPFLGKAIKSAIMNGRINKDLKEKMLREKVIIESGSKYEGLIFVKKSDYKPQFSVTLQEQTNKDKTLIFDVDLSSIDI